ncbi:hypothetical protein ABPG72_002148 [Tetrahymena utriculariae]
MDAEEKFLEAIQQRKRNDLHQKFFQEDGQLQFIISPLFTNFSGKKKIVPYRNPYCLKPECVYDEQELINRFKLSGYSTFTTFICHTCRKSIQLLKFIFDQALEGIIQDVWKHFNKESKLICEKVKIFRNGTWEPILPAYIKNLELKLRQQLEGDEIKERKIPGYDIPEELLQEEDNNLNKKFAIKKMVVYKNLIKLTDFNSSDYQNLLYKYQNEAEPLKSLKDLMFKRYGENILNSDFISIQNETYFPKHIMAFFMKYLEDWANRIIVNELDQKSYLLNKKNPALNKARFQSFFVVKILSYDSFYRWAKYEIWSDNINSIKQKLGKDQYKTQIDKIFLVMHYDERWILTVSDPRSERIKIVDFLDREMSRIKVDEIDDISKFIIEKELFPIKVDIPMESPEIKTINYYSDCGFYISNYLYKAMITDRVLGELPNFNVKFAEKNRMRDLLCWLFLKYSQLDDADQQIQMKDLEPLQESHIEDELEMEKEEMKQQNDYENDIIQRWNLDRQSISMSHSNSHLIKNVSQKQSPRYGLENQNSQLMGSFLNENERNSINRHPSFQSESSIHSNMRQSIGKQNKNYDSIFKQQASLKQSQNDQNLIQNQQSLLQKQKSNSSQISQNSQKDKLPSLKKVESEQEPFFVSTKGELKNLLQNWYQNVLQEAMQLKQQKEEEENLKKQYEEVKLNQNLGYYGNQNMNKSYDQQNEFQKLLEIHRKNFNENRQNFIQNELDKQFSKGIDHRMLDQLTVDDLSNILIQFQQLKMLEHPKLQGLDVNELQNQFNNLKIDPLSQNLGLDFSNLNPQEMMELAQFNQMLQQSILQTVQRQGQKENKSKKRAKSKRDKSKKSKKKSYD